MPQIGGVQRPLQVRRTEVDSVLDVRAGIHRLRGLTEIIGIGETLIETPFPVRFIDHPSFSYGVELGESEPLVSGHYPRVYACVASWIYQDAPTSTKRYAGVRMGVLADGFAYSGVYYTGEDPYSNRLQGPRWFLHWQFEGTALRGPTNGESGTV